MTNHIPTALNDALLDAQQTIGELRARNTALESAIDEIDALDLSGGTALALRDIKRIVTRVRTVKLP